MKRNNLLMAAVCLPMLALANGEGYAVPDIAGDAAPLPLLNNETPLSERDHAALKYANQWLQGQRYPYRDGDRVVYLYDSGQPTLV